MKVISYIILIIIVQACLNIHVEAYECMEPDVRGSLVIVGGKLEPGNTGIYQVFIKMAGRYRNRSPHQLKIGVLPTGSAAPAVSAQSFRTNLSHYGVLIDNIEIIPIAIIDDETTEDVDESSWKNNAALAGLAAKINDYDGIWFVGGDQARYISALYDARGNQSPVLEALWKIYQKGAVLGGTSAGAAIMSTPMIGAGESFAALSCPVRRFACPDSDETGALFLSRGTGFFPYGIVDQHFNQRGRLGRLVAALVESKQSLGWGIDENTAMILDNKAGEIRVAGENALTIVDLRDVPGGSIPLQAPIKNISITYLEKDGLYDLDSGECRFEGVKAPDGAGDTGTAIIKQPVFNQVKEAVTARLAGNKESSGIVVEMEDLDNARGFLVRFSKEKDTFLFYEPGKSKCPCAAIKVRMDIIPVTLEVNRQK